MKLNHQDTHPSSRSFRFLPRWAFASALALGAVCFAAAGAAAGTVTTLHTFTLSDDHQGFPVGNLVQLNGQLYGTNEIGIGSDTGAIFATDPITGTTSTVYTFHLGTHTQDGNEPDSGLIAANGKLYGATQQGNGTETENVFYRGLGTLFSIDPASGQETVLRDLTQADGGQPSLYHDPLAFDGRSFYGAAYFNGPNNNGTIYKVSANGRRFSVLYAFPTTESGSHPVGVLIASRTLYGTTTAGGTKGGGTLYSLNSKNGIQTVLYNFDAGSLPVGQLLLNNGDLVGVTQTAGQFTAGTVYKFNLASKTYTLLHTFTADGNDGDQPAAGLTLLNGVAYGVTQFGPGQSADGTIYTVDLNNGTVQVVADLGALHSGYPQGGLLSYNGALYGTTTNRFEENSYVGTVFKYTP